MQENFLIIDTETTVGNESLPWQSVFDIGWTISNRKGEKLKVRSYVVQEFIYQALDKKKAFLIDSGQVALETYLKKIENGQMKVQLWRYIIAELKKDIKRYNIEFIGAYNLAFDKNVIEKTHFYLTGKELEFFDNHFLIDLYHTCAYTVLNTDEYKAFAKENNFITGAGNYQTGAEVTYKYLFNSLDYIEEHTAASDSIDETRILHHLLNRKEFIPIHAYSINSQAWRIVNEKKIQKMKKKKRPF